jgi:uncharacterized coiled-coil protein SlyX
MKQITINLTLLATVAAVIIMGGVGYLIGYLVYSARTNSLENQVYHLENEVAGLEIDVSEQEIEISTMEDTVSTLEDTVSALEDTVSEQQDTISSQQQQISLFDGIRSSLQQQLDQATTQLVITGEQLSGLQERLNSTIVTHQYTWYYRLQTWKLDLPVYLLDYIESKERPRPTEWSSYVDMAKDTKDDSYIYQVVYTLHEPYLNGNLTELQTLDYVITFIRNMPYIVDNIATPYDGIPRYPLETLFEREGDSEDTSILVAGLLHRMGYDVALLVIEDTRHMAVGVYLAGDHGSYFEYNGKKYFYLETTQLGWSLGEIPAYYQGSVAQVFPLSN